MSQPIGKSKLDKSYIFKLPIYGYMIKITVSRDIKESVKNDRIICDLDLETTSAIHFPVANDALSLLYLPLDATINDIAHEGCHVAQRIIEWIGAGYKDKEFVAYLYGHVVQGLYGFHQKAKKYLETH